MADGLRLRVWNGPRTPDPLVHVLRPGQIHGERATARPSDRASPEPDPRLADSNDPVRDQLRREIDPAEYRAIRELWKKHSIAEDARDLPGLIATLTEDCVYEVFPGGHQWVGHEGATAFYTELLTAFPDVHFELTNIVIGPQGVFEEARVTATHRGVWLGQAPTGEHIEFTVVILFPWNPERQLFTGERVHFHFEDAARVPV